MSAGADGFRPGSFRTSELEGADAALTSAELAEAYSVARQLEAISAASDPARPSPDFSARVMGAVAREPLPRAGSVLDPLRRRRDPWGLVESVREAWAFATSASRPIPARAMALAYVLAIAVIATSLTGTAAFGVAGAFGLLGPHPSPTVAPNETTPPTALPSPAPSQTAEPSESVEPTGPESPEPSETEDTGGGSPGATSDHSGDGESDHPKATETPHPSESDHEDSSPRPSSSDDHEDATPGETPSSDTTDR
jgi:hypothetical protein